MTDVIEIRKQYGAEPINGSVTIPYKGHEIIILNSLGGSVAVYNDKKAVEHLFISCDNTAADLLAAFKFIDEQTQTA
jgi:hypothetical protein